MDEFQQRILEVVVSEFGKLPERQKLEGVLSLDVARLLTGEIGLEESYVDAPDYKQSHLFNSVYRAAHLFEESGLAEIDERLGGNIWIKPTEGGISLARRSGEEKKSPWIQGRRIVVWFYEDQQDLSELHRRIGKGGQLDLDQLCAQLGIDRKTCDRGIEWALREGFLDKPSLDQLAAGELYITNKGMSAVENDFRPADVQAGQTIDIHDNTVAGDLFVAGHDAMKITSPEISANEPEIMRLLEEIQDSIDTLGEDDDDRHDACQEIESLQREFSKESPTPGRIERSLNAIGGLASIGTLAGPQLARLLELAGQLPT